jgi:hypothetical protein
VGVDRDRRRLEESHVVVRKSIVDRVGELGGAVQTDSAAGIASYRVLRNGTAVGTSTTMSYRDGLLSGDGSYAYAIAAVDKAGNVSAASPEASVTYDSTAPTIPSDGVGASPTSSAPSLSWTAATDALSGVAAYRVTRDAVLVGTTVDTTLQRRLGRCPGHRDDRGAELATPPRR